MHHKVRELLVSQRTQALNAVRGHLAEIGIIAAQGPNNARALAALIAAGDEAVPVRAALMPLVRQLERLDAEIARTDHALKDLVKADPVARRLTSQNVGSNI
jgi:transposase